MAHAAHVNALLLRHAALGDLDRVRELVEVEGADIEAAAPNGATALMLAAESGHVAVGQVLLDAEADVNAVDSRQRTALMRAVGLVDSVVDPPSRKIHQFMTLLLVGAQADVNMADVDGKTALMVAAGLEDTTTLRLLLGRKAEVDAVDGNGDTALIHASRQGMAEAVDLLLDEWASVETRNKSGMTALTAMVANVALTSAVQTKLVEMLVDADADVDSANERGLTALMAASSIGRADVVIELAIGGASVNARCPRGNTALMYAVQGGHSTVVAALLREGADPTVANQDGETVVDLLPVSGDHGCADEIIKALEQVQARAADMIEAIFFRDSTAAVSRDSVEGDDEAMSDAETISSDLVGGNVAEVSGGHTSDFASSLARIGQAFAQQIELNVLPAVQTSQSCPQLDSLATGASSASSTNFEVKAGELSAVVERSGLNDCALVVTGDCNDSTNFPYHYAVMVSGDDVDRFEELVEGIASDPNAAKPVRLVRRTKSVERICAVELAHLLGYHDLGDYLGARSSNQLSREASTALSATEAVSVKLLEDLEDFPVVYSVVMSKGSVTKLARLPTRFKRRSLGTPILGGSRGLRWSWRVSWATSKSSTVS